MVESEQGVTLTILPGTEIRFEPGAALYVGYGDIGYLKAEGTEDEPIVFTSASSNPSKGDWKVIHIRNGGAQSVLKHCQIRYGGTENSGALIIDGENNAPEVTNCVIEESQSYGVDMQNEARFKTFENNTIMNSGSTPLRIHANALGSLGENNSFEGNAHQAIAVIGGYVDRSAYWRNFGIPYRILNETLIEGEASTPVVEIEAGTTLEFGANVALYVGYAGPGALYAVGTEDAPITFTGIGKSVGSWRGIYLSQYAIDGALNDNKTTVLKHAVVEYAHNSDACMVYIQDSKPIIENVTFDHGATNDHAIKVRGSKALVPTHGALYSNNAFPGFPEGMEVDHAAVD